MTDVFIGDLPAAATVSEVDVVPLDQGSRTVKATVAQIRAIPPDGLSGDAVHGGTISAFASTGIDDRAAGKLLTLSAAGNVGVGTAAPSAPLTVERSASDPLAVQLLLRNPGGGSNTAALGFQVSAASEYMGFGPKSGIAFERNGVNGSGLLKLYNRAAADTLGYQTDDVFLAHDTSTGGLLTLTPGAGVSIRTGRGQGQPILTLVGSGYSFAQFCEATGTGSGVAATAFRIEKHGTTSRSINAAGTVNATGLDYAEYMEKSAGCGDIAKGQLVGIDADGRLTDRFDRAHSFVVKSTNPSYVGGDVLTEALLGAPPEEPVRSGGEEAADFAIRRAAWEKALADWQARAEQERRRFDRIAFCGQVPIMMSGPWTVGDYVCARRTEDGDIAAVAVPPSAMAFDDYRMSAGRLWYQGKDGLPVIAVKVS